MTDSRVWLKIRLVDYSQTGTQINPMTEAEKSRFTPLILVDHWLISWGLSWSTFSNDGQWQMMIDVDTVAQTLQWNLTHKDARMAISQTCVVCMRCVDKFQWLLLGCWMLSAYSRVACKWTLLISVTSVTLPDMGHKSNQIRDVSQFSLANPGSFTNLLYILSNPGCVTWLLPLY